MLSSIYFISDDAGAIKIGCSTDVVRRLSQLNTASARKLVLIGQIAGERSQEQAIHWHLSEYLLSGEWFIDCLPVRELIRKLLLVGCEGCNFLKKQNATTPSATLTEARALANIIIRHTGADVVDGPEAICGVPRTLLWRLKYRPGKDVWASELTTLRVGAVEAIEVAQQRQREDAAIIASFHAEEDVASEKTAAALLRAHAPDLVSPELVAAVVDAHRE